MARKALTREDLLYILQQTFHISDESNNAFEMLADGLYVEDYHKDLKSHVDNEDIHIDNFIKAILEKFSIDENGTLYFNLIPLNHVSQQGNNALQMKEDGMYVEDYSDDIQNSNTHIEDTDIHVTKIQKQAWNNALNDAKQYIRDELAKLIFYKYEIVETLPEENINSSTVYLMNDETTPKQIDLDSYVYINGEWKRMSFSKDFIDSLVTKEDIKTLADESQLHEHDNKDILDNFTIDENNNLLYDGIDIRQVNISEKENNALTLQEGKLYVKDYTKEIENLAISSAFAKFNLLNQECDNSGVYELKGYIEDYSMLLIEYYYKPNDGDEDLSPGNAKSVIVDTDSMIDLYKMNIDYMLELGYGISPANSKIRMFGDRMWVNYYHGCCIYKITGIKRGDEE